jgi:ComF family protein
VIVEENCCICPACLKEIEFIGPEFCSRCGAPLKLNFTEGDEKKHLRVCGQCSDLSFFHFKNRSLGVYTGKLKKLIQLYKFEGRMSLSGLFADLLVKYKEQYIRDHDLIVAMPLTRQRYAERGFNQSHLMAQGIANRLSLRFPGDIIARKGSSMPQSGISSRKMRLLNVSDRFFLRRRRGVQIANKNILLIDDVLTTGATATKCVDALYRENAQNVNIITVARALKEPIDVYY